MSTSELACTYAALILADDNLEVSVRVIATHGSLLGSMGLLLK
jgi:hypothetical protein